MSIAVARDKRTAIPLPPPGPVGFRAPGGAPAVPNMTYVEQTEDNWCWAACGEMLFPPFQLPVLTQCDLASELTQLVCCPSPGAPAGCDVGCFPYVSYPKHKLNVQTIQAQLSEAEVQRELAAQRPVQVLYQWDGGQDTHVALIVDHQDDGQYVVFDPLGTFGQGPREFSAICNAYGLGQWVCTFTFQRG